MRSGSLCALLWRLLSWCNLRQIVLKARHTPGHLNVIADKLSRQGQVVPPAGVLSNFQRWNFLQPGTVASYPVPDPKPWALDALTVSLENLDLYAFPPVSLLGKLISKLLDHLYERVVLIVPGWPNML